LILTDRTEWIGLVIAGLRFERGIQCLTFSFGHGAETLTKQLFQPLQPYLMPKQFPLMKNAVTTIKS